MAIAVCKFLKISGGACPRTPLGSFLLLQLLQIKSNEKKIRLKSGENWCLLPEKNSEYPPDMKAVSKGLFTPVSGS